MSERFVGVIRNETERMIRLVTDLLHLSRLDSNQAPLRRRQTNIHDMLDEVADRFSFQLRQKSIRAAVHVEQGLESAWLDRDQIDQVLDNLFSNAIKYTLDGGTIELTAKRPADSALLAISVKDTGIGIPKRTLTEFLIASIVWTKLAHAIWAVRVLDFRLPGKLLRRIAVQSP